MGIQFFQEAQIFKLDANHTTYMMALVDQEKFLGHVYFGRKISDGDASYLMRTEENPFTPEINNRDRLSFYDAFPTEYSGSGLGDFREPSIEVTDVNGDQACRFTYVSHEIYKGKPKLPGLPATFGKEDECETLEITCIDEVLKLKVVLVYSVFEKLDAITRSVRIYNESRETIYLNKVMSCCIDFDSIDFEMITLHGSWARERHIQRKKVGYGKNQTASTRGESGHQNHPFMALVKPETTEDMGEAYGFNLVYSGNFMAQAEGSQFDTTRFVMGINPWHFRWQLKKGESFIAPEVVMVYSNEGIGQMSRTFHDVYRQHLIRSSYKDLKRPILINNWEATYFDFDTNKLLAIADEAAKVGIEMLVMDDGWFGNRNDDNSSLGDWFVNEEKLKGGLKYLVDEVNKRGLKFGIWFEPEMISPDSKLYEAHPDWAFHIEGRVAGLARNQYVLDLTRPEVVDYVYGCLKNILESTNITYVKWDMNRPLTDVSSCKLPAEQKGEIYHRYVLAVYELLERLTTDFPNLLLEGCSGGGARFDPGMLYYSPQIWCSDDTDAIERLEIQQGTAMMYPLSSMGAHVSDCPNHTVGRSTPFKTRGHVALAGTFGYELDVTRIPEEDRNQILEQVALYHKYNDLIRRGDYYRLKNYTDNHYEDAWSVVAKDKSEALVTFVQVLARPNRHSTRLTLKGLDPNGKYQDEATKRIYSGDTLMYAGLLMQGIHGDFTSKLIHLIKVEV